MSLRMSFNQELYGEGDRVMLRKGQWLVDMESPIYSGSGECQRSRVGMEFELGGGNCGG